MFFDQTSFKKNEKYSWRDGVSVAQLSATSSRLYLGCSFFEQVQMIGPLRSFVWSCFILTADSHKTPPLFSAYRCYPYVQSQPRHECPLLHCDFWTAVVEEVPESIGKNSGGTVSANSSQNSTHISDSSL